MLDSLLVWCSSKIRYALVKADLIPQLMTTLNPLSLSLAESVDIHVIIMAAITNFLWLSTPNGLRQLEIEHRNEQKDVHKTVLKQIVVPSEKYISCLCVNRYSIIDSRQSNYLMDLLTGLLWIRSPHTLPERLRFSLANLSPSSTRPLSLQSLSHCSHCSFVEGNASIDRPVRRTFFTPSSQHNSNRNWEPRVPCVDPAALCAADCVTIADAEHTVLCWERDLGASSAISPIAVKPELRGHVVERADASAKTDWFGEHEADIGGLVIAQLCRSQRRAALQFNPKLTRTSNRGMPSMRQTRSPLRLDLVALKTLFSCHATSDHRFHIPLCSGGTRNEFEAATTGNDYVWCRGGSITGQPLPTPSTVFPHTASTISLS
ncbi:hypothetical protein BLNAU_1567 [Blattamonas nauphoetae]|uniref:Uncharacterized protein n=1 Tax=Blattamonas nauphoetae TaxID=2049346 RepID=A0ABQ9YID9_9EUKA|nr:hypothetical protein BLNAU_1567 [Blattamonas nauphoetae]